MDSKKDTNNDASKASVPDYGGGADGDMHENRNVDPTRNAGTAAKTDGDANDRAGASSQPSRKDEIDRSTDDAVKAGIGAGAAGLIGAAILGHS